MCGLYRMIHSCLRGASLTGSGLLLIHGKSRFILGWIDTLSILQLWFSVFFFSIRMCLNRGLSIAWMCFNIQVCTFTITCSLQYSRSESFARKNRLYETIQLASLQCIHWSYQFDPTSLSVCQALWCVDSHVRQVLWCVYKSWRLISSSQWQTLRIPAVRNLQKPPTFHLGQERTQSRHGSQVGLWH